MSMKHFPADTSMEYDTFLNDKKMDGELYNYLLSCSYGEDGQTVVYKSNISTYDQIAEKLGVSKRTITNHMAYFKEKGYVIDDKANKKYILPKVEKMYFQVPQETTKFLKDVVKDPVIKTYIYLGQRNSYKPGQYVFTLKEICEHLGLYYERNYKSIKNYLVALSKFGLIEYIEFYDENIVPRMRLLKVSTECPKDSNEAKN